MILSVMNVNSYAKTLSIMGNVELGKPCDNMKGSGDPANDDPPDDVLRIMGDVSTNMKPCPTAQAKESKMNKDHCIKTLNIMGQFNVPTPCEN